MSVLVPLREDRPAIAAVPLHRLVAVELRKAFDTSAARAVVAAFVLVGVGLYAYVVITADAPELAAAGIVGIFVSGAVPIVTALVMTSEWGQRTAMTTFWLEPRRLRVLVAKVLAAVLFAGMLVTVLMFASLALGAVVLVVRGQPLSLDGLGDALQLVYVLTITGALFGVAWGALLMSTPVTLVFVLVISLVVDLVLMFTLGERAPWFSTSTLGDWLAGERRFSAAVLTSTAIWYAAPLLAGIWLQVRREVR